MKYLIAIIVLVFGMMACDGGLTTTLKVDPPEFEDLMVIDAYVDNLFDERYMRVGRTFSSLDRESRRETLVDSATVRFIKDGTELFQFEDIGINSGPANFYSNEDMELEAGSEYTLEVTHPKYGVVTATQTYPAPVELKIVEFVENGGVDIDGEEVSRIKIEITDPGQEDNYYTLGLVRIDEFGNPTPIYIWSFDPLVEEDGNYDELLLPDVGFNGNTYQIELLLGRWDGQFLKQDGFMVFKRVTEDFYRYNTTLRTAIEAEDFVGFTEPALVHSNWDRGLGCFLLSNVDIYPIEE